MLAKQISSWAPSKKDFETDPAHYTSPSLGCMALLASLLAMHFLALSAGYRVTSDINDGAVSITYTAS
jgi:hypothetical protein